MSCRRADEIDLARYLVEPTSEDFDELRRHWPTCVTCARVVLEASGWEDSLRSETAGRIAHPLEEMLLLWADDAPTLDHDARSQVARHVSDCPTCADEVRALRSIDAARRAGGFPTRWLRSRAANRSGALLAAALVALALAGSLLLWRTPNPVDVAALGAAGVLPSYVAPSGASAGMRRSSSAVRGATDAPHLVALAPDHVGRTGSAEPTLFFHLDRRAEAPIEITISDPAETEPLVGLTLAPPRAAGIHAVDLGRRGVKLRPGVPYQWSVALAPDAEHGAGDVVASAVIERVVAQEAKDADALAQAGLFYDALAAVTGEIAAHPDDPHRRARRAALLDQVGLGAIADADRR